MLDRLRPPCAGWAAPGRRVRAQRPASSMPKVTVRRRRAAGEGPAPVRRGQKRAQAPETVGIDEAQATNSASASSACGRKQAGALDQLVEEGGAMFADEVGDGLGLRAGLAASDAGRQRRPQRGVAPREKGDGRGPHGRGAALAAPAWVARPQPGPGYPSGQALIVEPGRLVFGDPRGQDFGFPGAGRRLEPFELSDHRRRRRRDLPFAHRAPRAASRAGSAGNRGPRPARSRRGGA